MRASLETCPCSPCSLRLRVYLPPPHTLGSAAPQSTWVELRASVLCSHPPSPALPLCCASQMSKPEWGPRPPHLSQALCAPWAAGDSRELPPGTRPAPEQWPCLAEARPRRAFQRASILLVSRSFLNVRVGVGVTLKGVHRVELYRLPLKTPPRWGLTALHLKIRSALPWLGVRSNLV